MKPDDLPESSMNLADVPQTVFADALSPLLRGPASSLGQGGPSEASPPVHGVVTGSLLALADQGRTALVTFAGQAGEAAVPARSVVDLHAAHIGRELVLMFEQGDVSRPIVMGVLRPSTGWPLPEQPGAVEVDVDGERMVVSAKEQLVLRCGKASITLTKAGKVLIDGSYVSSKSSGVNRVKGGSVQLN